MRAALVASCLRGALPPVDLRAVCLVRAIVVGEVGVSKSDDNGAAEAVQISFRERFGDFTRMAKQSTENALIPHGPNTFGYRLTLRFGGFSPRREFLT